MARRDSGSGSIYKRKDGLWAASITLPDDPATGKRRRRVVTSKSRSTVIAKLRDLRKELDKSGDLPTSSPRLSAWLERWDKRHLATLKPSSAKSSRRVVALYIEPPLGKIRLDRVTPADVYRMHDYVTDTLKLSSSTANHAHRVLRKALNDAMRQGLISRNVATLVDPPRLAVSARKQLTADQAKQAIQKHASDPHLALRLALAFLTGMRPGEILGLTWDVIDLERGIITVAWQLQSLPYAHGCEPACGTSRAASCPARTFEIPVDQEIEQLRGALHMLRPKSRKGWREVPIAPLLLDMLKIYKSDYAREHPRGLVFVREDGHPVPREQDWETWKRAMAEAGVPVITPHESRRTAATLLFELGIPEQVRMAILGHSSATVTQGYTHVADREAIAAMDSLGELLALGS